MQTLINILFVLAIVAGVVAYIYARKSGFRFMVIAGGDWDPLFVKSDEFPEGKVVIPILGPSSYAAGTLRDLNNIDPILLSNALAYKSKIALSHLLQHHFPKYFDGAQIADSIISIGRLIGVARDTRQIKNMDAAVTLLADYIEELNRYYRYKAEGRTFYGANKSQELKVAMTKLGRFQSDKDISNLFNSLYFPWA